MQWLLDGGAAQAAKAPPAVKEVRAQAFLLVNAQGRELARLAPTPEGSGWGLLVLDSKGKPAVGAATGKTGSAVGLFDSQGTRRMTLGVAPDGVASGMFISRSDGRPGVTMGVGPQGVGLNLSDEEGRERASTGLSPTGDGRFVIRNQENSEVWHAP